MKPVLGSIQKVFRALAPSATLDYGSLHVDSLAQQWSSEELRALLYCEHHKPMCTVTSEDNGLVAQTLLIGCDASQGHLLLDDFFPRIPVDLGSKVKLNFPAKDGELNMVVKIIERVEMRSDACLLASVESKYFLSDRRQLPRTQFSMRQQPGIQLHVPMHGLHQGKLINVSTEGFMMNSLATEKPCLSGERGFCEISFHNQFELHSCVKVQAVRWVRKPYRHVLIRGLFVSLDESQQDRLNEFVTRHLLATQSVNSERCA